MSAVVKDFMRKIDYSISPFSFREFESKCAFFPTDIIVKNSNLWVCGMENTLQMTTSELTNWIHFQFNELLFWSNDGIWTDLSTLFKFLMLLLTLFQSERLTMFLKTQNDWIKEKVATEIFQYLHLSILVEMNFASLLISRVKKKGNHYISGFVKPTCTHNIEHIIHWRRTIERRKISC